MKVSVVILNWNGKKWLEKFIPGVQKSLPEYAELVVADNQSTDDSIDFLKTNYPDVRVILNESNGGFAKGYNEALQHVNAEYYVLLNSDIDTPEPWLEPVIDFMEQHPEVGICQPKVLDYSNPNSFEYAGASGGYIDYLGFPFCRGRLFNILEEDQQQYNEPEEVFWATGACMFVRSTVFWEVGGFDEDFFAHMEEIDVCWRAKLLGHQVYCIPEAKVYHVGGGTLPKYNPTKPYLNFRNNLIMLMKNWPSGIGLPFKLMFKLMLDGVAAVKFLTELDPIQAFAVFRAHMSFYAHLPKVMKKRKVIAGKRKFTEVSGVYLKSIVWQFFVKKRTKYSDLNPADFCKTN